MARTPPAPRFVIDYEGTEVSYTEVRLVRAIRSGELGGDELFRREDEGVTALRPLHTAVLFQQTHGVDSVGAARLVDVHKVSGFSRHLTSFLAVVLGLTVMGVNTSWAVFWLIAVAIHFGRVAPSFTRLYQERGDKGLPAALGVLYRLGERAAPQQPQRVESAPESAESQAPPSPRRVAPIDPIEPPLHQELRAELARFEPLIATLDDAGRGALDGTRAALDDLFARRDAIGRHLDGEDGDTLVREAAELETELADPGLDARTREALEQTLEAVNHRREALADARRTDALLRARGRAVLHQLKSLRLSLVSSAEGDALAASPLDAVVASLRADMAGDAELEEALAEARQRPGRVAARTRR